MTSLWCLIGLMIGAATVSVLGAAFSIFGLADLFSGAVVSVMIMAGALEFSKFFIAAYLHQAWGRLKWVFKTYLFVSVVILSLITSMGIFGYLSSAYQEASSKLDTENIKLSSIKADQARFTAEIDRLNKSIDEIPVTRITKKMMARKEAEPVIADLQKKINALSAQLTDAELHIIDVKKRVGPLIYIAKAFNLDIDSVVKYLILVFVSVFDPLAICMIIAVSESLQSRQKEKERLKREAMNPTPKPMPMPTVVPAPVVTAAPVQELSYIFPENQQPIVAEPIPAPMPTPFAAPAAVAAAATPQVAEEEMIQMRFAKDKKVI